MTSSADEPVLPSQTSEDTDVGWSDDEPADDDQRLRDEVPPHHVDDR